MTRSATRLLARSILALTAIFASSPALAQDWKPVEGTLKSRWAKDVDPANPWPEYPRPTMVRKDWLNLNGLWDYAITPTQGADAPAPEVPWQGQILVPFPVESSLSGVGKRVSRDQTLHYRRTFTVPAAWQTDSQRIRLHFGAVDWRCRVFVNGAEVGFHDGGFDAFSLDITSRLREGPNELRVDVTDPGDSGGQPRGKQWDVPRGIWYTPATGIWQTVWLEPVPATSIAGIKIDPDAAARSVTVSLTAVISGNPSREGERTEIDILDRDAVVAKGVSTADRKQGAVVTIPGARLWTPADPFLYQVRVRLMKGDKVLDQITSYCALRDVSLSKFNGVNRLALNGAPTFMFGPLDQGYWPDGLYTPPNEAAMRFDIEAAKRMGCNMLRKHVKVESERFYYLCDTLGIMVWQDMPSPFFQTKDNQELPPLTAEWKANYESELLRMIQGRQNHPSIVMWIPWNEGWGQNDLAWSKSMVEFVKQTDPSRLVNCASGWTDTGNGDVLDIHAYPSPATPPQQPTRAAVLGEYGGLGLPIPGHTWVLSNNWGYVSYKNPAELTAAYLDQLRRMPLLIAAGLSAAVYTQTTDVEIECNGWLTYDREIWKIDPDQAAAVTKALYAPAGSIKTIVAHAGHPGAGKLVWRYTTLQPPDGWESASFDDAAWATGPAGFGTPQTPGAVIGTQWNTADIWIRRTIDVAALAGEPCLWIHHDEDAEVFIDGTPVATLKGYTNAYILEYLSPAAAEALKGKKSVTIAIHCRQTTGGQYIDAGLAELSPPR